MSKLRTGILLTALLAPLSACAGSGFQRVPRPTTAVSTEACRVYIARDDSLTGSIRNVRVFDGDVEIGLISADQYLCWDRRPTRGVGKLVFEGLGPDISAVENVFDLPRDAGTTTFFSISIPHQGHKPEIAQVSEQDGRAMIAARSPAPVQ